MANCKKGANPANVRGRPLSHEILLMINGIQADSRGLNVRFRALIVSFRTARPLAFAGPRRPGHGQNFSFFA